MKNNSSIALTSNTKFITTQLINLHEISSKGNKKYFNINRNIKIRQGIFNNMLILRRNIKVPQEENCVLRD